MDHLLNGLNRFQTEVFAKKRALFQSLAQEQHPRALFITCSDSRVDPNLITQAEPGELFVLRNAGNIIPPHGADMGIGQEATIDYAIHHLGVHHIIVCGHTDCGAIHALMETPPEQLNPPLRRWLSCAEAVRQIVQDTALAHSPSQLLLKAIQTNVKVQLRHVATLPAVAAAMERGTLQLHGWVYCMENAEVFTFNAATGEFQPFQAAQPTMDLAPPATWTGESQDACSLLRQPSQEPVVW